MKKSEWVRCGALLVLIPLVSSGYEAVPAGQLVGQWLTGAQSLSDSSGYTPSGTHDAVLTNVNQFAGFQNDAPSGFSGYSYYLLWNTLVIKNSATSDAGYVNTFDNTLSNQFTITFWAKGALPSNWQPWMSKGDMTAAGGGWHLRYTTDGTGRFTIYNGLNCDGAINTDTAGWHHYAAVWSKPDGGVRWFYQDGTLVNSAANAAAFITLPSAAHLCFGGYQKSADQKFTASLGGTRLYDLRVYKQKMSQDQVKNIMTAPPVMSNGSVGDMGDVTINGTNVTLRVDYANPLTNLSLSYSVGGGGTGSPASGTAVDFSQGPVTYTLTSTNGMAQIAYSVSAQKLPNPKKALVGRWLASSANLRDYSDYAPAGTHDGIATNGTVSFSTSVPAGFQGSSLVCAQSSSYVRINNSANTDAGYLTTFDNTLSNQFTVAFWGKGLPSSWQQYVGKSGAAPDRGWAISKDGDQGTNQIFHLKGVSNPTVTTKADMNDWHHFVLVWDQSNAVRRIYIDGVVTKVSNTAGQSYAQCPDQPLQLGSGRLFGFGGFWLYDVRIYKQLMFKAEVDQIRTVPDYPRPKGTIILID